MTMRRKLGAALAGLLAVMLSPGAANAVPGDEWFFISNGKEAPGNGALFLTIPPLAGVGSGAVLQKLDDRPGRVQWKLQYTGYSVGGNPTYAFRNAGTSNQFALSIERNDPDNGTRVVQWWYQPSNRFQQWYEYRRFPGGSYPTGIQYRNVGTGKCLAVAYASNGVEPNDPVIIWDCGTGAGEDQRWALIDE